MKKIDMFGIIDILETVREPLLVLDANLNILSANRSFYNIFKVEQEETIGHLIFDIGNKQWDIPKLRTLLEKILPKHELFDNYEVEHDFPNIGHKTMLLNARQIYREDVGMPMILLAIEDITERKNIESGLEKARKELEAFSYSVSHDLRAPLRHIAGFVELLMQNTAQSLDEKSGRYLKIIADSTNHMGHLIDDILSFSRMGKAEMKKTLVNLDQLVKAVLDEMQPEMEGRDIVWDIHSLPEVHGDADILKLVWVNLIGNALKYTRTKPQSKIEIGSNDNKNEHIFFIKDNGVGFDMTYADKLFGVFQRLHSAEEFEGTGVGLANVKRIIQRHGGRVWAEGTVNEGATFYFSIPV